MAKKALTSRQGRVWIQPDGPGTPCYLLSGKDADELAAAEGESTLIQVFSDSGSGWETVGDKQAVPDKITFGLTGLLYQDRDYLEKVKCPFSLYALVRDCGRADVFSNYVRGQILHHVRRTARNYANLANREEDNEMTLSTPLEAWQPLLDVDLLTVDRVATTETEALNGVATNATGECAGDCGEGLDEGDLAMLVADSAVAPAVANALFSSNKGLNFTATATDPFAGDPGIGAVAIVGPISVGRNTRRWIAARQGGGADQGKIAFTDNDGATWTTVDIGGAAAGLGAVKPKGLFALDVHNIWLAGVDGTIHKSIDGGETWTVYEEGDITVNDYNVIHFADELYGIAGGPGDVIAISSDGGESWDPAAATGGGGDILAAVRFDKWRMLVGDDDGKLWQTLDGGKTWNQVTGWPGSGSGAIVDLEFANEYQGWMLHNSAVPVGTVLYTINGGADWEVLETPTNAGLNSIRAATPKMAFVVGEPEGGTAVILRITG